MSGFVMCTNGVFGRVKCVPLGAMSGETVHMLLVPLIDVTSFQGVVIRGAPCILLHMSPVFSPAGVSQPRRGLELPYFSKYLLIASYLASYNPSKSDKKFFSKVRLGMSLVSLWR